MHESPPDPRPIVLGGRYEVRRRLSADGGRVKVLAWDRLLLGYRAITMLLRGTAREVARFLADIQQGVSHPGLDGVLDSGHEGPLPYVVRDWLPGTVADHLKASGRIPAFWAAYVALRCAGSLEWLHDHGVAHGAVAPPTVGFAVDGEPVITDLGWYGPRARASDPLAPSARGLPVDGAHLAPCVRAGAAPTAASDVYGLGALLYTMVAGTAEPQLPFAAAYASMLDRIDRPLRELVVRATADGPEHRRLSVRQFSDALHRIAGQLPRGSDEAPWDRWLDAEEARSGSADGAVHREIEDALRAKVPPDVPGRGPGRRRSLRVSTVLLEPDGRSITGSGPRRRR